jgi:uncharacterized protein YlxP (DUF503 family)
MILGILQFELLIPDPESLKDKRNIVKSLKDRLHREHLCSVAEVAMQDSMTTAVLGLALVGSDGAHIGRVLDQITAKLHALADARLNSCTRQILHGSQIADAPPALDDTDAIAREMLAHFDGPQRGQTP